MRANTNISLKDRKILKLGAFKGADYSSSPLDVSVTRATFMRNFINENGVNKKRNGWCEREKFDGEINGIFEFKDGDTTKTLIYAGTTFYIDGEPIECKSDETLESRRVQFFTQKGKVYIIGCGDFLVLKKEGEVFYVKSVADDEDTYVPTTTISINEEDDADTVRDSLDKPNLLSSKRKNQCILDNLKKTVYPDDDLKESYSGSSASFTLDGEVDTTKDIVVKIESKYRHFVGYEDDTKKLMCGKATTWILTNDPNSENPRELNCVNVEENTDCCSDDQGYPIKTPTFKGNVKGTLLTLGCANVPISPLIEGVDNVTVTFYVANYKELSERITKCRFGALFGVNAKRDHLFLSGNESMPSYDFHSYFEDFTYFPDDRYEAVGREEFPISGYQRISDGTLAVYKNDSYGADSNVYYRTAAYVSKNDENGSLSEFKTQFSLLAGTEGEGIVNSFAAADFYGDNIIVSKSGVYGVVLTDNVTTRERYTRERSRLINERLRQHNLSESVGIVYKNKYYLAVDGYCYVADSRYKFVPDDTIDGSYNYEWWVWENIPARTWGVINDELYFGTADGRLCSFDNEYTDRTIVPVSVGAISPNYEQPKNKFTVNDELLSRIRNNDKIKFTSDVYALVTDIEKYENSVFYLNKVDNLREGMAVHLACDESISEQYTVTDIDRYERTCKLKDSAGGTVSPESIEDIKLVENLRYLDRIYITNLSNTDNFFSVRKYEDEDVEPLEIYLESIPNEIGADIYHVENVVAEWHSPVMDLGTTEASKTLLKMTVVTEPNVSGRVSFGYVTRSERELMEYERSVGFSLENLNFNDFSFEGKFASSYSVRCNERNFNFIMFRFLSDTAENCAVNNLTAVYKINKSNMGVH